LQKMTASERYSIKIRIETYYGNGRGDGYGNLPKGIPLK